MRLKAARLRLVTRGNGSYEDLAFPPSTLGEWEIAETENTQIINYLHPSPEADFKLRGPQEDIEERGDLGVRGPGEARVYRVLVCLRSVSTLQALLAYFILAKA